MRREETPISQHLLPVQLSQTFAYCRLAYQCSPFGLITPSASTRTGVPCQTQLPRSRWNSDRDGESRIAAQAPSFGHPGSAPRAAPSGFNSLGRAQSRRHEAGDRQWCGGHGLVAAAGSRACIHSSISGRRSASGGSSRRSTPNRRRGTTLTDDERPRHVDYLRRARGPRSAWRRRGSCLRACRRAWRAGGGPPLDKPHRPGAERRPPFSARIGSGSAVVPPTALSNRTAGCHLLMLGATTCGLATQSMLPTGSVFRRRWGVLT